MTCSSVPRTLPLASIAAHKERLPTRIVWRQNRGVAKRNLTITVDEDVARWARVKAAEEDTSVAQLVGDMLRERMREGAGYDAAMREHLALLRPAVRGGVPRREELHDRRGLRG